MRYFNRSFFSILLLGFASGVPLALTSSALQAWYTVSHINIVSISLLGLLGQPYVYKFLWAPLLDRFDIPGLSRRKGWLLLTQLAIVVTICLMSLQNPAHEAGLLALTALFLAFFSATQDIVFNAYQTEILAESERGLGVAYGVAGYRIAMLVSGAFAFILADRLGWAATYRIIAVFMGLGIIGTLLSPKLPKPSAKVPHGILNAILEPIRVLLQSPSINALLIFIILYKLGDAFVLSLNVTFLIRVLGFSQTEVGLVAKVVGFLATILGVVIGGGLINRMKLYHALLLFALLQALSNLFFVVLIFVPKNIMIMGVVMFVEQLCGGMGTAALIVLIMTLCDIRYTATQYALLSALASIGRVFVSPLAGLIAQYQGWIVFYIAACLISLPSIILLYFIRSRFTSPFALHELK